VEYRLTDGTLVPRERIFEHIGLVGPYLQLYQELSAQENLDFFARMRGLKNHRERIRDLMQIMGLQGREHDAVKTYSSGMQQRLKYVSALLHQPEVLLVDEPSSNLDEQGVETVYQLLKEQKQRGILIIATNDKEDLFLADHIIQVKPV
jgi:heme exporter protein A